MKLTQEAIAMYSIGTVLIGAALWMVTTTVTQAEFDEHVASNDCRRATDRWITKANQLDARPKDKGLKKEERQAREDKNLQCGKKG